MTYFMNKSIACCSLCNFCNSISIGVNWYRISNIGGTIIANVTIGILIIPDQARGKKSKLLCIISKLSACSIKLLICKLRSFGVNRRIFVAGVFAFR